MRTGFPDLQGYGFSLQALCTEDAPAVAQAVQDGELWTLVYASAPQPAQAPAYIDAVLADEKRHAYAVRDAQGQFLGTTSLYFLDDPQTRRVLVGYTWYRQSVWRSATNTACKLLLMQYAFEVAGMQIVAWETDILNTRSQAAIERLGAQKDGVIRGNRLRRDGTVRDTVVYSMTAAEWPPAKARLLARLEG